MTIEIRLNKPDEGDSPENRYDCGGCGYAPEADENILLVLDEKGVWLKLCLKCAEEVFLTQWLHGEVRLQIGRNVLRLEREKEGKG